MTRLCGAFDSETAADMLREEGYLVIRPGDTSPLGELVMAAVEFHGGGLYAPGRPPRLSIAASRLAHVADVCGEDPAVRAWTGKAMDPSSYPSE